MNRLIAKLTYGVSRLAFWRKPDAPILEQPGADASTAPPLDADMEAAGSADASEPRAGRFERAQAALPNKRVWIPAATAMLLGLVGAAMALMPSQPAQEKEHLQAERPAPQKKSEQTGAAKNRAAVAEPPARVAADLPASATGGSAVGRSRPGIDGGECEVSDKASVTRNLKTCIDSFNRSRPVRVERSTRKAGAKEPREI